MADAMNDELTISAESPCADCGKPIGVGRWKQARGRVYHEGCKVHETPPTPRRPGKGLGSKAERAARNVLNPGQERLGG